MLFIGAIALSGISINYLSKSNSHLKGYFADITSKARNPSKINLNKATVDELTALSGIGPELARRIIDYRAASGGFKTIEELKKVKGIGARKFELVKDQVSVE